MKLIPQCAKRPLGESASRERPATTRQPRRRPRHHRGAQSHQPQDKAVGTNGEGQSATGTVPHPQRANRPPTTPNKHPTAATTQRASPPSERRQSGQSTRSTGREVTVGYTPATQTGQRNKRQRPQTSRSLRPPRTAGDLI